MHYSIIVIVLIKTQTRLPVTHDIVLVVINDINALPGYISNETVLIVKGCRFKSTTYRMLTYGKIKFFGVYQNIFIMPIHS